MQKHLLLTISHYAFSTLKSFCKNIGHLSFFMSILAYFCKLPFIPKKMVLDILTTLFLSIYLSIYAEKKKEYKMFYKDSEIF